MYSSLVMNAAASAFRFLLLSLLQSFAGTRDYKNDYNDCNFEITNIFDTFQHEWIKYYNCNIISWRRNNVE